MSDRHGDDISVHLHRTSIPPTADQALWVAIRASAHPVSFDEYDAFLGEFLSGSRRRSGLVWLPMCFAMLAIGVAAGVLIGLAAG